MVGPNETVDDIVHARASPEEKLQIVREWKQRGEIVGMTGDGVNDAPALREAHIGIAMGKTGTAVTREASDIVLADDNYASIIAGVREGRGIFDNIRKAVVYLLGGNASELAVMLVAALLGWPLPLLPIHLLWINLITDGAPALALVMDPTEDDVMTRPPRRPSEALIGRAEWVSIGLAALLKTAVTLGVFVWALSARDLATARDLAFTVLVFSELFRSFASRSTTKVFWQVGALGNVLLVGVVVASVLLQFVIHHLQWTQSLFDIEALSSSESLLCLALGLVPVTVIELLKIVSPRPGRDRRARLATTRAL
jgi:Ca2+-transporting ATPase